MSAFDSSTLDRPDTTAAAPATASCSTPSPRQSRKASAAAVIPLLPQLVESSSWAQREKFEQIATQLASLVEATHPAVSKRIRRYTGQTLKPLPMIPPELAVLDQPRFGVDSVILPTDVARCVRAFMDEQERPEELSRYNLEPRHRLLLHGPPGNGKTILPEAIAHDLGLTFLRARYGGLIASYLGESGKNLDKIFDYAGSRPCVLFFDEFDGVGMSRSDARDVGEMRRITNQLLITLERLPSHCVFVASTNSLDLIDPALVRRFDFRVEIPKPTADLITRCVLRELDPAVTPGFDLRDLAPKIVALQPVNLDETVKLCRELRRDLVLNSGGNTDFLLASFKPSPAASLE